jgi:hypothetical protein
LNPEHKIRKIFSVDKRTILCEKSGYINEKIVLVGMLAGTTVPAKNDPKDAPISLLPIDSLDALNINSTKTFTLSLLPPNGMTSLPNILNTKKPSAAWSATRYGRNAISVYKSPCLAAIKAV